MLQPALGTSSAGNSGSGGPSDVRGSGSISRSSGSGAGQISVERTGPTSTAAAVTSAPAAESASNGGGYLGFI